jgi:serine/threonine protein phosphatase PrpC
MFLKIGSWYMKHKKLLILLFMSCYSYGIEYVSKICCVRNQGSRPYQEDFYDLQPEKRDCFFDTYVGVFDGHGGDAVAKNTSKNLYNCICSKARNYWHSNVLFVTDVKAFLEMVFSDFDEKLRRHPDETNKTGSTAAIILLHGSTVFIANIGDSEVVSGAGKRLTQVHNSKNEEDRLIKTPNFMPYAKQVGAKGITYFCSVTRSFGDFILKQDKDNPILLSTPFVTYVAVDELAAGPDQAKFVILASDGIWDNLSAEDASKYVNNALNFSHGNLAVAAKGLVMLSIHAGLKKTQPKTYEHCDANFSEIYASAVIDRYLKEYAGKAHDNQVVVIQQFHERTSDWTPSEPMEIQLEVKPGVRTEEPITHHGIGIVSESTGTPVALGTGQSDVIKEAKKTEDEGPGFLETIGSAFASASRGITWFFGALWDGMVQIITDPLWWLRKK